jgi:hypothetical protein
MRMQARPIHAVDERRELGCAQAHHPVADRRPPERPVLQPLPKQHQAGPVPRQDLRRSARFDRKMKSVPENGSSRSCSRTRAARRSAPRRKSTGLVATSTRTPAGTAITSPPSRRAAPSSGSRHQSRAESEPWQHQSRSRSLAAHPGEPALPNHPGETAMAPRSPARRQGRSRRPRAPSAAALPDASRTIAAASNRAGAQPPRPSRRPRSSRQ